MVLISTFVVKSCIVLARYFLRVGPRATSTGLWRHFHRDSNFWILTLFGSGYAGLGHFYFALTFDLGIELNSAALRYNDRALETS